MKTRYRLTYRGSRGGMFYCVDTVARKRASLHTVDEDKARQIVEAKNLAERQPEINLQIAKAYLAATDSGFVKRTWREVMAEFVKTKTGSNRTRSERAIMDKAFDSIRDRQLIETRADHFLRVLESNKVSTNNYLRRFHNFAVDMGWIADAAFAYGDAVEHHFSRSPRPLKTPPEKSPGNKCGLGK